MIIPSPLLDLPSAPYRFPTIFSYQLTHLDRSGPIPITIYPDVDSSEGNLYKQ